ncbi:substrate-binding domain-containing protein [Paenibacillus sp. GCM10012307]|uniref:Sugar-binding protein n=1 Tax=Paenibacillus roseus TaxID=2798579 RepID=A0A934MQT0_9BACL|nr:sugar-binding protein [Paenibacillus roseus]MBJ6361644.1 sugar-binding protein [Paenibacillus roseus]
MKKIVMALVLTMLVSALAACSTSSDTKKTQAGEKKLTIAVVPKALDNAVFLDSKDGAEAAGKEIGVEVIWTGPTKSDAAEQVQVVEGLIQKKVDGILISVIDPNALKDVINKAVDAGIKVATFDSDSPDSKRSFYAGTENFSLGKQLGEAFAKLAEGKGTVKLATLTGVPGSFNLEQRIKGFKEGAAGVDIEYLPVQASDDDVNKAVTVLEQYTQANSDLNAWFVVGAWPFLTPTETLPTLKKFAGNGGIIVSVDSFYPMLQYVKEGTVKVEIGQDFIQMGALGVKNLVKAINGEQVEPFIDTGTVYVDETNVEEVLKNTKPW